MKTVADDRATTMRGAVTGRRVSPSEIVGTSPAGDWRAYLPLNGQIQYSYPIVVDALGYDSLDPSIKSAIRRVVYKLIHGPWSRS